MSHDKDFAEFTDDALRMISDARPSDGIPMPDASTVWMARELLWRRQQQRDVESLYREASAVLKALTAEVWVREEVKTLKEQNALLTVERAVLTEEVNAVRALDEGDGHEETLFRRMLEARRAVDKFWGLSSCDCASCRTYPSVEH